MFHLEEEVSKLRGIGFSFGGFEYGAAVPIERIGELKLKSFGFE